MNRQVRRRIRAAANSGFRIFREEEKCIRLRLSSVLTRNALHRASSRHTLWKVPRMDRAFSCPTPGKSRRRCLVADARSFMNSTDEQLLSRVAAGDQQAFG